MTDDYEGGMTLREEVDADLEDDLVNALHASLNAQSDETIFLNNLVRVLTRYKLYREHTVITPKKERQSQVAKLKAKASQMIEAIDSLAPDIEQTLETGLSAVTGEARWAGWSFDRDEPVPADDRSLMDARNAAENIVSVCELELAHLAETKGRIKGSANPALDQLLTDLAAIFEAETGRSAQSQCYRDDDVDEQYNGAFFVSVKRLLDSYAPRIYDTPAALGIRILRVQQDH